MLAGIYLVSACGSAEEFVAAFRRYADKTGLFVPLASPLPQGKKGRIAITLTDGGVMLEGEAEIVQASTKSPLHGRAGVTLKFVDLDEPSKIVLAELEKARLAMKPAPPSVPPRPADVPAQPRAVVPPVGGRIDAANALAECVAIGDPGQLEDIAGGPPKAGPKFVVPSIPSFGGRPKAPTAPPEPKPTSLGMPALKPPAEVEPRAEARKDPTPAPSRPDPTPPPARKDPTPAPVAAAPKQDSGAVPAAAPPKQDSGAVPAAASPKQESGAAPAAAPAKPPAKGRMTQIGFPVVKPPADTGPASNPFGTVPLRAEAAVPDAPKLPPAKPPLPQPTPTRSKSPTAPPRQPTPFAPLPVAKLPAKPAPVLAEPVEADEKTDLSSVPLDGEGDVVIQSRPPAPDPQPAAKPQRSGGMRASEIMAAVEADDWTMAPDASQPTVLAPDKPSEKSHIMPEVPEPTPGPGAPPTGDWTMSLDPAEGWSQPAKVQATADKPTKIEKRVPAATQTPSTGNPVKAVSSDKPIDVQAWEDKPTSIGAKIEIDATLMEPLAPMPAGDDELAAAGSSSGFAASSGSALPPMMATHDALQPEFAGRTPHGMVPLAPPMFDAAPPQIPDATGPELAIPPPPLPPPPEAPMTMPQEVPIGFAPTLLPGQLAAPAMPPPQYAMAQPGDLYRSEAMPVLPARSNKRLVVIVASVLVVMTIAIVVAVTMGGGKKKRAPEHAIAQGSAGSAAVVVVTPPPVPAPDAATAEGSAEGSGSAAPQVVTPPPPPPPSDTCSVEVTTTPAGAEVSLEDKHVLGTTPGTFPLPCGTQVKLTIKKPKYLGVIRQVTPAAEGTKVAVALGVATFSVKVTSTPAGATILVGGKSRGVTPTAVQLPAFQTVTITLTKEGYGPDTERVVIKANGQSHHVTLKKAGRTPASHGLKGI